MSSPFHYSAIGRHNVARTPQWAGLDPELRRGVDVVAHVLPFRTNPHVLEHLIDWSRVPDDPIFQLVFPQRGMLETGQFERVARAIEGGLAKSIEEVVRRIRYELNPHPGGQLTHNVPEMDGRALPGIQHKYRETVLFFPAQGQTCHAYCTYCFRWAQFVDSGVPRIAALDTRDLVPWLRRHPAVTDLLITGGDPMIMRTDRLRRILSSLLVPGLEHVQTIRIGTKSLAYWPQRFVTDPDADDCLRLFEEVVDSGRQLAIMGQFSHPIELQPLVSRQAIRRVRDTGAQIRMQAPLVKHVNDRSETWSELWREGVRQGLVPYYMFVERDTGARSYFEVPLERACAIYRGAVSAVSGLARTARGPSMSALPGKVRVLGVMRLRDILGGAIPLAAASGLPTASPDDRFFLCDFLQARDPALVGTTFCAAYDPEASWFDQLRPAFGQDRFSFDSGLEAPPATPLHHLTECVLM